MEPTLLAARGAEWQPVELPGRGTTYLIDVEGPAPHAPVVVLLHGWIASGATNWTPTLEPLAEHFRVLAIDHRGHGRGIRDGRPFTLEDCADDVAAVLDEHGIGQALLVGYSMGGPIAQLVWQRHRARVAGLVCCATAADFGIEPGARRALAQTAGDALRVVALAPGPLRRAALAAVARLAVDADATDELVDAVASHDPRMLADAIRAITEFRSTEWIAEIDVPVAAVIHERDRVVPLDRQVELAELTAATRIHLDANHTAPFNDAGAFTSAVVDAALALTRAPVRRARRRGRVRAWWARVRARGMRRPR